METKAYIAPEMTVIKIDDAYSVALLTPSQTTVDMDDDPVTEIDD